MQSNHFFCHSTMLCNFDFFVMMCILKIKKNIQNIQIWNNIYISNIEKQTHTNKYWIISNQKFGTHTLYCSQYPIFVGIGTIIL